MGGPLATFALLIAGALLVPRLVQLSRILFVRFERARARGRSRARQRQRHPRLGRVSATAAALMAGAALTVGFGTFTTSFIQRSTSGPPRSYRAICS